MIATKLIGFYCPKCEVTEQHASSWRVDAIRETKPNFQYHAFTVPVCWWGHDMDEVELCNACLTEGQLERINDATGLCAKHTALAARSQNLTDVIREIALLPGKERT